MPTTTCSDHAYRIAGRLALGERYYSITTAGASLGLHMDERHEETKGERELCTDVATQSFRGLSDRQAAPANFARTCFLP